MKLSNISGSMHKSWQSQVNRIGMGLCLILLYCGGKVNVIMDYICVCNTQILVSGEIQLVQSLIFRILVAFCRLNCELSGVHCGA